MTGRDRAVRACGPYLLSLPWGVMRLHAARLCACLAVFGGAAPLLAEDELHLANGAVIVGVIVAETPTTVQIRTQAMIKHTPMSATLTVELDQIENRFTVPSFADQYLARAALSPNTTEGHLALARWCIERCLVAEAESNVQSADTLDPYNSLVAQFYKELGFVHEHDTWVRQGSAIAKTGERPVTLTATGDKPATPLSTARTPGSTSATPVDIIARPVAPAAPAAPAGEGTEVALTVQAVPAPVLAVMTAAARGHPLSEYVRDLEDGAVVYSAVFTGADNVAMEVTVSKDAELIDLSPLVDEPEKPSTVTLAGTGPAAGAEAAATEAEITQQQVPAPVLAVMTRASGGRPLSEFVRGELRNEK